MAAQATFLIGTKIAVETDRGSAPSGNRAGQAWWMGGRWHDLVTDGAIGIQDRQAVIFPAGAAGERRVNQQPPVVGRKWSEGDFSAPVIIDFLGLLMYGALGAASTNMTPHTTASLMSSSIIETNPKSYTLTNQPNEGGAILRIELKGGVNSGDVSISGIDVYGNPASEIISFTSGGTIYSRTAFSSIGANGFAVCGISTGSVTVVAIKRFTHTFWTASSSPSFSFEKINDPTAGNPSANLAFRYVGNLLQEWSMSFDAESPEGIITTNATFQGEPTFGNTSAKTAINAPSPLRIWPAWTAQVTRDNGVTWNKVANLSLNVSTGNRNLFSAAGAQGPQAGFVGPQEMTGDITVHLDDEAEYDKWQGASQIKMYMIADGAWKLTSALDMSIAASIPAYFEGDMATGESDNVMTLGGTFRVVRDDSFPFQFQLVSGVPGTAYGNSSE